MVHQFEDFVKKNNLFSRNDQLLLAMSGGKDSACLFHLLLKNGYNFSIAHCNYGLRGSDSIDDENFCKSLAHQHNIGFHVIHFDTLSECKALGTGIQETARTLRYQWFESLCRDFNYQYVLTAHQKSDNTETMLINLFRSTGVHGLQGIPLKIGNIRRPLLFADANMVLKFLTENQLSYRTDLSNDSDYYLRNKIRNHLIREMKDIQSQLDDHFLQTAMHVHDYISMSEEMMKDKWLSIVKYEENKVLIDRKSLDEMKHSVTFLYYNLRQFGFTQSQCSNLLNKAETGAKFYANTYVLNKDRDHYVMIENRNQIDINIPVNLSDNEIFEGNIEVRIRHILPEHVNFNSSKLYLDASKCQFPLRIRNWKSGDKMQPLGMKGQKNISDILTDLKIANTDRQKCLIIEDAENKIIGLFPDKPSDLCKLTLNTADVLCIEVILH